MRAMVTDKRSMSSDFMCKGFFAMSGLLLFTEGNDPDFLSSETAEAAETAYICQAFSGN